MVIRIVLILACSVLANASLAQEIFPDELVGFFKAGQHVGVRTIEKTGVVFTIYDSKDVWDMMLDATKMSFSELRKKYPEAEKQALEHIELSKKNAEKQGLKMNKPNPDVISYGPFDRFGKVLKVGKDYVLVEFDGRRSVFAAHSIEHISWGDGKFQLYAQSTANP